MKILLLGKNGQVGWELQRSLAPLGELVALGSASTAASTGLCGNFNDLEGLAQTIVSVRPDAVVNAAAYTAVDKAESEPDAAAAVNALAPGVLARAAHEVGACMIHYSTDYVFDGSGDRPWAETDTPAPLSVYGRTKLEGERLVAHNCPRHLILRTSWVYASRGGNFARTMLRLARERDSLAVIDDQFGAPTGADLLADITAHALRGLLADGKLAGTYHVTAGGVTTWHAYAQLVIGEAVRRGMDVKATPQQVKAVPTSAFPTTAKRPNNSRLDTSHFRSAFGLSLPPWEQGVARMLEEIL